MKIGLSDYLPIIYIYVISITLTYVIKIFFSIDLRDSISIFLGIFSLIFAFFKIIRLRDFVEAFSEYDFITQKFRLYGYIFPFIELVFGILFLYLVDITLIELVCLLFFSINFISVLNALSKNRKFVCACLGDLIKLPLSKVSLFENLTMIFGVIYLILN
jgi:hypothetical protein